MELKPKTHASRSRRGPSRESSPASGSSNANSRNPRRRGPSNRQRRIKELDELKDKYRVLTINGDTYKDLKEDDLKRLFGDTSEELYLSLVMVPSDPDFPFEVKAMLIHLCVPGNYPARLPSISLLNDDIPIGYGANVEKGFTNIARQALKGEIYKDDEHDDFALQLTGKSLAAQLNTLDKNLEFFLSKKKQNAVKVAIRKNKSQTLSPQPQQQQQQHETQPKKNKKSESKSTSSRESTPKYVPPPSDVEARDKLLSMLTAKLPLRLFQRSNTEFRYQIEFPISATNTALPDYMVKEKSYRVLVCIPLNYPDNKSFTITPYVNYSKQLILKYKLDTDQFKQFKALEKNLVTNFKTYNTKHQNDKDIISQLNWVSNNLDHFMLTSQEYNDWIELVLVYN